VRGVRAVDAKGLRKKLKKYLRLVAEGETVLILQRDRVIGQLVPTPRRALGGMPTELVSAAAPIGAALPALEGSSGPEGRVRLTTPPWL
jgi:antitoxin (DNA-binding transcriptional repressor) of toxin-antitoxin stability system